MPKRFVSIWFKHLLTDWAVRRQPKLKDEPFVIASAERGRMVVKATNVNAERNGITIGMVVADCRAILPELKVLDWKPEQAKSILTALAEWHIRYTPVVALHLPDGLILDASGCAHLWGGENAYLKDIFTKMQCYGYDVNVAMADTVGAAWAMSHFGPILSIIEAGKQLDALLMLPTACLRLDSRLLQRMEKLGLYQVNSFIRMPRRVLFRRFGAVLLTRLDQALGNEIEAVVPVQPVQPYQERLPSLEPIRTPTGIEIALRIMLENLCKQLTDDGKGLRTCKLTCYRVDGNIQKIDIGTNRVSRNVEHLFKLFCIKIPTLEPALGFEMFILQATIIEEVLTMQDALWQVKDNQNDTPIAELLDRVAGKVGMNTIHRYLPDQHYWPERSIKTAANIYEKAVIDWRTDLPRPILLLPRPELITVSVPVPDYPPMLFHYNGKLHNVTKADGPERIEQEWWLNEGLHRDYYCVEDEDGARFWLFRLGSYGNDEPKWYIHGFFA